MPLTAEQITKIRAVFERLEVGDPPAEPPYRETRWWSRPSKPSYGLDREGLEALWSAVRAIARASLAGDGFSPEEAERVIMAACEAVVDNAGEQTALDMIDEAVDSLPVPWTVVKVCSGIDLVFDLELFVGGCLLRRGPPKAAESARAAKDMSERTTVSVQVLARDVGGAEVMAVERFDEAMSLLRLADLALDVTYARSTLLVGPTHIHDVYPPLGGLRLGLKFDNYGRMDTPPTRELSFAAAKPVEQRTEWERRCLSAARWLARAYSTPWVTDALVACTIAVEAVLGEPGFSRGKSIRLGSSFAALVRELGVDERALRKWFIELYISARSPAVHFGAEHLDELAVERLKGLCPALLGWAVAHLDANHAATGRPCATLGEVRSCDNRADPSRR